MKSSKAARRPSIHMSHSEAEALTELALAIEERLPDVSEMLLTEIARANLHNTARVPPDVVTMHSTVRFLDEANGKERSYQLVYPKDADISSGRISILTPVGAGLIGMRTGQSILWPDRDGRERTLSILGVAQPQEAV